MSEARKAVLIVMLIGVGFLLVFPAAPASAAILPFPDSAISLPTTGIVGLCIVAAACVLAGAFIIMRRE